MSHNAYIRGSIGAWATGTQVSQAEFWQMDQYLYGAINGDAGGAWAPSSAITLGGTHGLILATGNPLTVGGDTALHGNVTVNGTFSVSNSSWFVGNVELGSTSSHTLNVKATTTFQAPISTASTLTISGGGEISVASLGQATIQGNSYLGSTPGTTGKSTNLIGDLCSAGGGGRTVFSLADLDDDTYNLGYYYRYVFTTLTVNRPLYLTIDNPRVGTEFHVHNKASTYLIALYIGGVYVANVAPGTSVTVFRRTSSWDYVVD